jgi:hypothetical protein
VNLRDIWPTLGLQQEKIDAKNAHPTKRGPGRKHDGHKKRGAAPKPPRAGVGFVQHKNPRKNARRTLKAEIGARQYRKQRKALALAAREAA